MENTTKNFWEGAAVIDVYRRAEAIANGELVDVTEQVGGRFKVPVALTRSLWEDVQAVPEGRGETAPARLADVLDMALFAIQGRAGVKPVRSRDGVCEVLTYSVVLTRALTEQEKDFLALGMMDADTVFERRVKIVSGPGDAGEHVITLMQTWED